MRAFGFAGRGALAMLCALALSGWVSVADAQVVECQESFSCTAPTNLDQGIQCMCAATRFFDEARGVVGGAAFASFDQVLPSDYEITGKYSESLLDEVIAFARSQPRSLAKDELLFEASFRKASAHGMFGDDSLLRGLDPRSGGGGAAPEQVLVVARKRLDSRVCHDDSGSPVLSADGCAVDGDCQGNELCLADRFGEEGPYGAVQEYRRAEQALMIAIRDLGVERFRLIDEGKASCLGIGCAARLLVRLGSLKARAQAEYADLLWRRATAVGQALTDAMVCREGSVDQVCSVHSDCDSVDALGRCGSEEPAAASTLLLRQVVQEAVAEASVAEMLYDLLVPGQAFGESSDMAQRLNALARLRQIDTRSREGLTPFGIPSDYVPLLSSVQESYLDCLSDCGTTCDRASNTRCLQALAEGPSFLNLLEQARAAQDEAVANAQDFADATRNQLSFENEMEQDFVRTLERLFGSSCEDLGQSCECSEADAEAGLCVRFDGETWVVQGLICNDPDDPTLSCEIDGVDGEVERQIMSIRSADVALEDIRERIARNEESYDQVIQRYASLAGIRGEECTDSEAAISTAASRTSSAIDRREKRTGPSQLETATSLFGSAASGAAAGAKAGGAYGAIAGFLGGAVLGVDSINAEARRKRARADYERITSRIQTERELELSRIRCRANQAVLDVEEDDALFQVETERQQLSQQFDQQNLVILDALVGAQQLAVELRSARERYMEARELREIYDDLEFRNPANFRALALAKQLEGADKFRTAQVLTWMILRSVAYDLALPDFALPQTFRAGDVLTLSECRTSRCSEGGQVCATSSECTASSTDICALDSDETGVADSEGSCSMQAVFAARTVDDLESLIGAALLQLVADNRTLACEGECQKRISLRNIFTEANQLPSEQPRLGDVLLDRTPVAGTLAVIDFGVSPKRGFRICPTLPDGSVICQPEGVANLSGSDVDGFGNLSANIWNARMVSVKGIVRYDPVSSPSQRICRNPADGGTVNTRFTACRTVQGIPLPEGSNCEHAAPPPSDTGCFTAAGFPTACKCLTLLATSNTRPVASMRQIDTGVVRTPLAEPFQNTTVIPRPAESLIRYQMRRGDLPILGTVPNLEPFRVPSLTLFEDENLAVPQINIKGVPVASSRWQLRLSSQGLLSSNRYRRAFLRSILDIELILTYQGFDL